MKQCSFHHHESVLLSPAAAVGAVGALADHYGPGPVFVASGMAMLAAYTIGMIYEKVQS